MAFNQGIEIVLGIAWVQSSRKFDCAERFDAEIYPFPHEGLFQEGIVESGVVGDQDTSFQHLVDTVG